MWMARGPGGLAPAYGIAFRRKDLVARHRGKPPVGCDYVRVIVTIDEPGAELPVNVITDGKGRVVDTLKVRDV